MKKIFYVLISITFISFFVSCAMWDNGSSSGETILPTHSDVLVMMYLDGDSGLNDAAWRNLYNAELGLMNLDSKASVTVIALIDGLAKYQNIYSMGGKTYLYKLGALTEEEKNNDTTVGKSTLNYSKSTSWVYNGSGRASQEVDMASGQTLYNFLNWAKTNFSAEKKILIFQNHGFGPTNELKTSLETQTSARSLCCDDTSHTSIESALSTTDVSLAIQKTFGKLDLIVEDVCLQASIEEVYGLQDVTNYLIASPNVTWTNTYNYDKIIPYISTGASIEDIGKRFVDYNMDKCKNMTVRQGSTKPTDPTCMEFSLTLVDCSKKTELAEIKQLVSNLADKLLEDTSLKTYLNNRIGKLVYDKFYGISFGGTFAYTQDLGIMAYMLANRTGSASSDVKAAATALYNKLRDSGLIVYGWAGGIEHNWYYSGDSTYGYDFMKITDGKCPWGISITCERFVKKDRYSLANYKNWTTFASENSWAKLLEEWKNTVE